MLSARDTALRLVAAVWNLGIPERAVSEKIIFKNERLNDELKAALDSVNEVSEPHAQQRNDIGHAGGIVPIDQLICWEEVSAKVKGLPKEQAMRIHDDAVMASRSKVANDIDRDNHELSGAQAMLFIALSPFYERQFDMIRAVEGPATL